MEFEMAKERGSFNFGHLNSPLPKMSSPPQRGFLTAQFILRILGITFTLAAIATMVTSKQSMVGDYGITFKAHYTDSVAIRFNVGVDVIVCTCFLMSLILVTATSGRKSNPNNYMYLVLQDMGMTVLMMAGCAAASANSYLNHFGQKGWSPICVTVPKFCHKTTLSIAFSYVAFICSFLLTIMAAYKLKSQPKE